MNEKEETQFVVRVCERGLIVFDKLFLFLAAGNRDSFSRVKQSSVRRCFCFVSCVRIGDIKGKSKFSFKNDSTDTIFCKTRIGAGELARLIGRFYFFENCFGLSEI